LPPAARGALFEKTAPLDPPQKLFINKKFLEVQKPFYKKVFGRRRHCPIGVVVFDIFGGKG
jgi:hypothetical protein